MADEAVAFPFQGHVHSIPFITLYTGNGNLLMMQASPRWAGGTSKGYKGVETEEPPQTYLIGVVMRIFTIGAHALY